jgi:hypothetical protein
MANKSVRIQTSAGSTDKYVTVKLENDVDFYEILSLKISQKDVYGSFNSDYGVIVGRVIANGGVGIPNAKLSVFIPISDEDKNNSEIFSVYPYSSPRDKDLNGVRYNLLPRVSVNNPFLIEGDYAPKVPVGTFPTKAELTTNDTFVEVYEKYYKFTTISNSSGDYMFFGVPVGIQTVHMSVDITDIGKYSMTPGTMITNLGYSPQLFTDNNTKVKFSTDLETLPNVELQEIAVNVRPFWGDDTNFEIGITRQDFKIRALLVTTFTLFGSAFTDAQNASWGSKKTNDIRDLYRMGGNQSDVNPQLFAENKRNGLIDEDVIYLPNTVSDIDIATGNYNTKDDYKKLDKSQYTRNIDNGVFVYQIPCNRKKIITDDFGNEKQVPDDNPNGVFTEFVGFFIFRYGDLQNLPIDRGEDVNGNTANQYRMFLKFPQDTSVNLTTDRTFKFPDSDPINEIWRKQNYKFKGSEYYSVARFHGLRGIDGSNNQSSNNPNIIPATNCGLILTNFVSQPSLAEMPKTHTNIASSGADAFAIEWLNFCIYIPQITTYPGRLSDAAVTTYLTPDDRSGNYINPNSQLIGDGEKNTQLFGRSDINRTAFIKVPKEDILNIIDKTLDGSSKQGFRNGLDSPYDTRPLIGTDYKSIGSTKYFYKGLSSTNGGIVNGNADVFLYLRELGII